MSLVSNEGEGEQNEIRNLQDKLNTTMKLVSHLTSQLNELKEQVWEILPKIATEGREWEAAQYKHRAPAALFWGNWGHSGHVGLGSAS